jgi:hypothetical protein
MRKIALIALSISASAAWAQAPFDGTWVLDTSQQQPSSFIYNVALANGSFTCHTCSPSWTVPADGGFHAVSGHDGYDEASVKIVDDRTAVFTRKKGGRQVYQAIDRISADGKYLVFSFTEMSAAGVAASGTGSWIRVSPKPEGAHAVTGQWRELKPDRLSENAYRFSIRTDGDMLHLQFGTGEALEARFGGQAVQVRGTAPGTLILVRRISATAFEETEMRDGEIAVVRRSELVDPSTLQIVSTDKRNGQVRHQTARRK